MPASTIPHKIVDYANPPVVEVVFGVWFSELEGFKSTDFGLLWQGFKDEYPFTSDLPPISSPDTMNITFIPDLRRVWFFDESREHILQIQTNLFTANWSRPSPSTPYKGYTVLMASFEANLKKFVYYVKERFGLTLQVKKLELKYVNIVLLDKNSSLTDLDNIFFATNFKGIQKHFLPEPTYSNMTLSFPMKNDKQDNEGDFRFLLNSGLKGEQKIVHWEMLTEKIFTEPVELSDAVMDWYNLARKWIVKGFTDLTSDSARKTWGQKDVD